MNRSTGVSMGGLNKPQEQVAVRPQLQHLFIDNKYFSEPWHEDELMEPPPEDEHKETWRLKEKMKTSGVALVVCLNIGTDPPDIVKPTPCARRECWFDPTSVPKQKGLEVIGNALQQQYEKWHSKAKYKQSLDPTSSELERTCTNLRRQTRTDRLLLHYNGHGVPRPTKNGELWVFGKHYTHYMPVNVYELRNWLGDPSIYVLDCSGAGVLLPYFSENAPHQGNSIIPTGSAVGPTHSSVNGDKAKNESSTPSSSQQCIVLAACQSHEMLPLMNPLYPADIFTACLTTPIPIAIRWFILQNPHISSQISLDISENIPGKDGDRKTPKGELNWIFTAVADTIAWSCLPSVVFQKMFRQDLLVASLFRNFLLAKRIMKSLNCTPQSIPAIPDCATHPLWHAWDAAVEHCLLHVHTLQQKQKQMATNSNSSTSPTRAASGGVSSKPPFGPGNEGKVGVIQSGVGFGNGSDSLVPNTNVSNVSKGFGQVPGPSMFGKQGPPATLGGPIALTSTQSTQQLQHRFGAPSFHVDSPDPQTFASGLPPLTSSKSAPMAPRSPRRVVNGPPSSTSATSAASSPFFSEQMTAFEIWLDFGGAAGSYVDNRQPPMCLPILLQALLSHAHRLKALHLLRRYVALGPMAVHSILAVGNYPYILKLLHNPVVEIRYVLMSIWTYVIGFDRSCREELVKDIKDKNKSQFMHCLQSPETPHQQRTMAAFIQGEICHHYKLGQLTCLNLGMHKAYISLLAAPDVAPHPHLKKWLAFCLAKLCEDMPQCKKQCVLDEVQLCLYPLLLDVHPFVRSSSLFALGELFGASLMVYPQELPENKNLTKEQWNIRSKEVEIAMQVLESCLDGCASVRREAVIAISKMIMLPIHFECLKHVATAIFEFTGETEFYPRGYLNTGGRDRALSANSSEGRGGGNVNEMKGTRVNKVSQASSVPKPSPLSQSQSRSQSPATDRRSAKSKFGIKSPLKPLLSKHNSESSSFYKKALTIDVPSDSGRSSRESSPSPERKNRFMRSNSCSDENQNDSKSVWELQSEHTMMLVRSVQERIESRMDLSQIGGVSLFAADSGHSSSGLSNRSPPPPTHHNTGYSVGVSLEDSGNTFIDTPPHFASSSQSRLSHHDQKSRSFQQYQAPDTSSTTTSPLVMTSQLSLQMATSYVHLWLVLTDIQNNDPHPIIAKSVRAIFMHMKVEVAKDVFRSTADGDDSDSVMNSASNTVASRTGGGDDENKDNIAPFGKYSDRKVANSSSTLLHLNERGGQEYGQNYIRQDKLLCSSTYDWNRYYFLKPDIGYNPYDDLLSDVGKERSLRMLMREEVKSLSLRIVENFRPIRNDGVYSALDGESLERDRGESSMRSMGRQSARESSNVSQKSRTLSGQDEDGIQAALLPTSLTKFDSKGIIRIEDADLSTSSLMFHAFHDILAISDNQGIGIWSLESGNQILHINSTTHLSTFGGQRSNSSGSASIGHGPMSPLRYHHHSSRTLPYRNNFKSGADMEGGSEYGRKGSSSNTLDSTIDGAGGNSNAAVLRVGGYGDPTKPSDGSMTRGYLGRKNKGHAQVTSMHWINESLDTLLMIGTDDGNIRIFRDVGSGIEYANQAERERIAGAGGGMFSHETRGNGGDAHRHKNGRHHSSAGSIYSGLESGRGSSNVANSAESTSTSSGVSLASAFQALPDISPRGMGGSGMISSWQQSSGMLSVGGNSSTIRLWDVAREMSVTTLHTGVDTCLTCLVSQAAVYSHSDMSTTSTSSSNGSDNKEQDFSEVGSGNAASKMRSWGDIVADNACARENMGFLPGGAKGHNDKSAQSSFAWSFAGFADGSIGIFDQRVSSYGGKVHSAKEHNSWIVSAHLRADVPEIITGAYSGVVKFWDIRSMRSYKTIEVHKAPMTSLSVHNCAPIMATGSHAQFIKILTMNGDQLGMIRHHKTFIGQRIGPVASLSFHPIRLVMAAACTDNIVSIYSIQDG